MNNVQSGTGEIQVLDVYGRVLDAVDISDARSASVQTVLQMYDTSDNVRR